MKAHWNVRSRFFALSALLVLFGIFLLIPDQAVAQNVDADGRTALQRAAQGPIAPAPDPVVVDQGDCDQDLGCKNDGRVTQDQIITGDLGVARYLQDGLSSFQVQQGAPINSVHIADNGNVGIGTKAPDGRLHVVAKPGEEDTRDIFVLDENGNLEIGGLLIEASSRVLKENFAPVQGQQVLEILATLPISTWNYKTDDPAVRHMGPVAQDFYAAFGLGADEAHIAPLDVNGVALTALQALYQQGQAQANRIATLEQQNAQLLQRLEALEAQVRAEK